MHLIRYLTPITGRQELDTPLHKWGRNTVLVLELYDEPECRGQFTDSDYRSTLAQEGAIYVPLVRKWAGFAHI